MINAEIRTYFIAARHAGHTVEYARMLAHRVASGGRIFAFFGRSLSRVDRPLNLP